MVTLGYAFMHFMVDFLCAWAMFGAFRDGGQTQYLIYNFCAFALQMPLGTLLDLIGKPRWPRIWAVFGGALTVAGALVHPALLGLGNALFHVGGGVEVIGEDFARNRQGRELGVFVAPGAMGLFLGTLLGKQTDSVAIPAVSAVILAALAMWILRCENSRVEPVPESSGNGMVLAICCFAVVILRSFVGMSVSFPWKIGVGFGIFAVAAVVLGKMAGGFLAARVGMNRAIFWSLLLASGCFLLCNLPAFGLGALFFFNMSMPMTLYLLACRMPKMPGFAFGLLTFGLFLGFLPVYVGVTLPVSGCVLGAAGSLLSLVLLAVGRKAVGRVSA